MSAEVSAEYVFQETHASGHSLKNWVTRYGGVSRCLIITVTRKKLRVALNFLLAPIPLLPKRLRLIQEQALTKQSDLAHCILKRNITSVAVKSALWKKSTKLLIKRVTKVSAA
jgi:hypothetical protein